MSEKNFDEKNQGQKAIRQATRPKSYRNLPGSIFFPEASMHPIEPSYQILVCNRGQQSTFSKLAKITTQNSIFSNFEAIFFKFRYLCGKHNDIALGVHNMLSNDSMLSQILTPKS